MIFWANIGGTEPRVSMSVQMLVAWINGKEASRVVGCLKPLLTYNDGGVRFMGLNVFGGGVVLLLSWFVGMSIGRFMAVNLAAVNNLYILAVEFLILAGLILVLVIDIGGGKEKER